MATEAWRIYFKCSDCKSSCLSLTVLDFSGQTLDCFQCELGFWDMCHTTKTNCSAGEQCFVGIGVAGMCLWLWFFFYIYIYYIKKAESLVYFSNKMCNTDHKMWSSLIKVSCLLASVLKIKMMGCLANDHCNKTTIVTFPANKTLYKMTRTCCGENYCNGGPEVLMASLTLMALVIAQIMGINL